MKRIIILLAIVSAMLAAIADAAQADESWSPITCGQNSGKFATAQDVAYLLVNTQWRLTWHQNCGNGGTSEHELQRLTLTGGIWQDVSTSDQLYTTPNSLDNQTVTITVSSTGWGNCNSSRTYRMGVWDAEFQNHSVAYLNPDGHGGGNPGC